MKILTKIFLYIIIISMCYPTWAQEQEKIFKKVEVRNIEILLRVLLKGKPVRGLNKEEFKLFVNDQERKILGFNEMKKKIKSEQPGIVSRETSETPRRLFLLIFNISDHHIDIKKCIDHVFDSVIKPNDRIMVLSNNFFLSDRVVQSVMASKKKIEVFLKIEIKKNRLNIIALENSLRTLNMDLLNKIGDSENPNASADLLFFHIQDYFTIYLQYLREARRAYLDLAEREYIKLADYLKKQKIEKYIINFFQIGIYPRLKNSSRLKRALDRLYRWWMSGTGGEIGRINAPKLQRLFAQVDLDLETINNINKDNIAKLFIQTEATMHTILLRYKGETQSNQFEYRAISTDTENVLREISKKTAGRIKRTTNVKEFLNDIIEQEDIYYLITYSPKKTDGTNPEIEVKVKNNQYKIIYDSQKRKGYFSKLVKKQREESPQVTIKKLQFRNRVLTVRIGGFKMVKRENKMMARFDVRIKIFDKNSKVLFDRKKPVVTVKKEMPLNIRFNQLKKGKYDFLVEVTDLLTGKNDLALKQVRVK